MVKTSLVGLHGAIGEYDKRRNVLKAIDAIELRVGYFDTSTYPDAEGKPVAEVAASHELGVGVPARPFIMPTARKQKHKWAERLARVVAASFAGRTGYPQGLKVEGLLMAADIQQTIREIQTPPLSPRTLEAKKDSKGEVRGKVLIDSGQMLRDVTAEVVRRGDG